MNGDNKEFFSYHSGKIIGGLLGLVIALLFVIFGFWQGLLIIVFVLAGALLGSCRTFQREMLQLFDRLCHKRDR